MAEDPGQIKIKDVHPQIAQAYRLRSEGKLDEAIALGQKCLNDLPQHSEVNFLLGVLYVDKQQYGLAERFLTMAIAINPDRLEYYLIFGQLMKVEGRFVPAKNAFLQCLKLDSKHFMALFHLARLYQQQHDDASALKYFAKAEKLNPDYPPLHYFMAIHHFEKKEYQFAIERFEAALLLDKKFIQAWQKLGATYIELGQYQKALDVLESARQISKNNPITLNLIGKTHLKCHNEAKASELLKASLDIQPLQPHAWYLYTSCQEYNDIDHPDRAMMETNLQSPNLSEQDKLYYHFALGKLFDDCENYTGAMAHFHKGHNLQAKASGFDAKQVQQDIDQIIKLFTKAKLKRAGANAQSRGPQPLFIIAPPNKSKLLLMQRLTENPNISSAGNVGVESVLKALDIDTISKKRYPLWLKQVKPNIIKAIRQKYIVQLKEEANAKSKYIIDTNDDNFLYVGLLYMLFPKAKFIYLQQNPVDASVKLYTSYDTHRVLHDFDSMSFYCQQYLKLMHHWQNVMPEKMHSCYAEAFLQDQYDVIKEISSYLKLKPEMSNPVELGRAHRVMKWYDYRHLCQPLIEGLGQILKAKDIKSIDAKTDETGLMEQAVKSFHHGDLVTAANYCEKVKARYPKNYECWHLSGLVHKTNENLVDAEADFKKAISLNKQAAMVYRDLSILYQESDRQADAEKAYQQMDAILQAQLKRSALLTPADIKMLKEVYNDKYRMLTKQGKNILFKGKTRPDNKTSAYLTRSWDRYFNDLSHGSFRNINQPGSSSWRMRSWHYLFKNMALIEEIFSQAKDEINICDIGCSSGYLRRFLEGNYSPFEQKHVKYWGVDVREDILKEAVQGIQNVESGADGVFIPSAYIAHDIQYGLPFKDEQFDYMVNFEMMKYLPIDTAHNLFDEMHRALTPNGVLYFSTTYTANHPGFLESVPYEQIEKMLKQHGFEITERFGSQNHFRRLASHIKDEHMPLVKELMQYHPPEMVIAMIAPLYPHMGEQVTFKCVKKG